MSATSLAGDSTFSGDAFTAAATRQFGGITQRFFATGLPQSPSLTVSKMGACGLSRISAAAHAVLASRASRRQMEVESVKILIPVKGRSQFRQNDEQVNLTPNAAVIYDPTQPYAMVSPTAVDHIILQIPRGLLGDKVLKTLTRPYPLLLAGDGAAQALSGLIRTACDSVAALTPQMRVSLGQSMICFTQSLLCGARVPDLSCDEDTASQCLLRERIKAFVRANLSDPDLSIGTVARRMGCSVRYLHRAFEAEGTTLQKYIWNTRLDQSRALLAVPGLWSGSITQMALRCGFSSTSHFSRLFRQRFGMPPTKARVI